MSGNYHVDLQTFVGDFGLLLLLIHTNQKKGEVILLVIILDSVDTRNNDMTSLGLQRSA